MTPPIIFLDIDGVLIAYPEGEHTPPVFTPRCVEAFKTILTAIPAAKVVFSSTWRLPAHVNRLHEQWARHGFPESLAIDGTPDLRGELDVSRLHRRGIEIQAWLDANPQISRWVVIDDEKPAIESILGCERCVFTNPARGLTEGDAERAGRILGSHAQVSEEIYVE
jgi:HAD domain in Swiss Army Knife RNA repair proteins